MPWTATVDSIRQEQGTRAPRNPGEAAGQEPGIAPALDLDQAEFTRLATPYRRELLAHCYRMLGSVEDAEDLVQETYLRAWRSRHDFEGRASLRTWLYRIATNTCLTELRQRGRRALPSGLAAPSDDPAVALMASRDIAWLQPLPDRLVDAGPADPATIVASRQSLRLALVAALQYLAPRQRAALILRDVLSWPVTEVAGALGVTPTAVNSLLQRARARLEQTGASEDHLAEPDDPRQQELLDRYAAAFQTADVGALQRLLTADAVLEMPPFPAWFSGRESVGRFYASRVFAERRAYLVTPTRANGQPAFASYLLAGDGRYYPHAVQVLTLGVAGIARITAFREPVLFPWFGLPPFRTRMVTLR
jgi:RNA polymerase sigma-70 factor (ECF subfamily)